MATRNKTKRKRTRSKRTADKKGTPTKKAVKKKLARKRLPPKKRLTNKKAAPKKAELKTKAGSKKTTGKKVAPEKRALGKRQSVDTEAFALEELGARSGGQSGDLQGLSNIEGADSESVGELIEEGNAFEADAVMGVEDAGDTDEKEVRTHEVPQDDVPGEYLDKE
jgi:hypothetical protein